MRPLNTSSFICFALVSLLVTQAGNALEATESDHVKRESAIRSNDVQENRSHEDITMLMQSSFNTPDLAKGQIRSVSWIESKINVSAFAHEIGLDRGVAETMQSYVENTGVLDVFHQVLFGDRALPAATERDIILSGHNWYIHRPESHWKSNMHWVQPRSNSAHDDFLRALGKAGFDQVLDTIGTHFELPSLVAYHLSFIGVTRSERAYIHTDVQGVDGKAFNVILPLMLVNGSGPELNLQEDGTEKIGRYKYRSNVAIVIGDDMNHGTAACDYRDQQEFRLALSVFVANVHQGNVKAVMNSFKDLSKIDTSTLPYTLRGYHWKRDDPTVALPGPLLLNDPPKKSMRVGEVSPVTWNKKRSAVPGLCHIRLPEDFVGIMNNFTKDSGILQRMKDSILHTQTRKMPADGIQFEAGENYKWRFQRVNDESDLHTISPSDQSTFFFVLRTLSRSGLDEVLQSLGLYLSVDGLAIYKVSFFGVHEYEPVHRVGWKNTQGLGKSFELVVPLAILEEAEAEVLVAVDDPLNRNRAHFKETLGLAYMIGNGVVTAMAPQNYTLQKQLRFGLSIRVAVHNPSTSSHVHGLHWNISDPRVKLPVNSRDTTEHMVEIRERSLENNKYWWFFN